MAGKKRKKGLKEGSRSPGAAVCAHLSSGLSFHQRGNLTDAIGMYRKALALAPENPEGLHLLGVALLQSGAPGQAVTAIEKAVKLDPDQADYYDNLGAAHAAMGEFDAAIEHHKKAISLAPDYANAHFNLGVALLKTRRIEEAEGAYRRALTLVPEDGAAWSDLGVTLVLQGNFDEAMACYRRALSINPADAGAHHNLSRVLLTKGEFEEGWREFEWRWKAPDFPSPQRIFPVPMWDGSDMTGKTILIHAEQGMGDSIQFIRYAPLIAQAGGRVIVECQEPLVRLFASLDGVGEVIPAGAPLPAFDVHLPVMSLPYVFRTQMETIPAAAPYLRALKEGSFPDGEDQDGNIKVGIVWAGSQVHGYDPMRSCSLDDFMKLGEVEGVSLYSLQKGPAEAELNDVIAQSAGRQSRVTIWSLHLGDFADTAAAVEALDLVISVDTAVAHLAGALGRPVWLVLPTPAEWRWLEGREDSPWYPTMRLFRQSVPGDWAGAFKDVKEALVQLVEKPPLAPSAKSGITSSQGEPDPPLKD